jgi:hypothetical protein
MRNINSAKWNHETKFLSANFADAGSAGVPAGQLTSVDETNLQSTSASDPCQPFRKNGPGRKTVIHVLRFTLHAPAFPAFYTFRYAQSPPRPPLLLKDNTKKINVLSNFLIHMTPEYWLHCAGIDGAEQYRSIAKQL